MPKKKSEPIKRKLAVLDLETDPFEFGNVPKPFAAGFYDGSTYTEIWSPDCVIRLVERLAKIQDPLCIFAHNGGKFDFYYFLEHLDTCDMRIVSGRIIMAYLGIHQLRDSFAIMPFKLAAYKKDEIDITKFHRDVREKHRAEILSYLKGDCIYLHELVTAFFGEFGDKLTIGSAAMKEIQRFHDFQRGNENFDSKFRKDFYFGGRNQCFKTGMIRRPMKIYDVNSMYPDAMKRYLHPISTKVILSARIEENTSFIVTTGHNDGAFPVRTETGGLDFTIPYGRFCTTIHEFNAALDTGCFRPDKIHKTYGFETRITFDEFVDHFHGSRLKAKKDEKENDKPQMYSLFYKFVLNSGYGKFAQNPHNYFEWQLTKGNTQLLDKCPKCPETGIDLNCPFCQGSGFRWTPAYEHDEYTIWQAPLEQHFYFNVTTGASITGAARATLLRGLRNAVNPVYCDTDSIICESLSGVPIHDTELGAWAVEAEGELMAIGGKKMYALFGRNGDCADCKSKAHNPDKDPDFHKHSLKTIKKAHKGARLTGDDIIRIASGSTVESFNPVPNFKLTGKHKFIKRKIRLTGTV